jgi:hypothetical protein
MKFASIFVHYSCQKNRLNEISLLLLTQKNHLGVLNIHDGQNYWIAVIYFPVTVKQYLKLLKWEIHLLL